MSEKKYDFGDILFASWIGMTIGALVVLVGFAVYGADGHDDDCRSRVTAAALADSALSRPIIEHCQVEVPE